MGSIPLVATTVQQPANPLDQYAKALSVKSMLQGQQTQQLQQQGLALENQNQQQAITDRNATTKAMNDWDGKDLDALPAAILKNGGSANAVFGLRKQMLDQKAAMSKIALDDSTTGKNQLETFKGKNDQIAGSLESLVNPDSVKDSDLYNSAKTSVNSLLSSNLIDGPHADQLNSFIEANKDDPKSLRQGIDHYAKTHMGASELASQAKSDADTFKAKVEGQTAAFKEIPQTGMFYNVLTGETKAPNGQIMSPGMMESKYVKIQQQEAQGQGVSPDDRAFARGYEKFKTLVPQFTVAMQNGLLTDAAKDNAANVYRNTGQMPTGISRSPAMVASIQNRAAEMGPVDLTTNRASFKANEDSLVGLQKNFDQVTAFENTAGKNLDTFLSTAKKISDTGSPWFNKPWRDVQSGLAGSPDLASFNAARTTALTEIAKVLNSSNASGVLSDGARGEVGALIGPDATMEQITSAANILKQDMANRHQSYEMQINDIKGRLGGAQTTTPPAGQGASQAPQKPQPPTGKSVVYDPSGNAHFIFQNKVQDFLQDPQYKGWHQ